jgi:hypothetical protein
MENGKVNLISVWSEQGGELKIKNVFQKLKPLKIPYEIQDGNIIIITQPNQRITLIEE